MFRQIIVINLLVCLALSQFKEAPYASWAHSHWVWQNGKEQNQANLENMVKEYLKRDIPVGAVNVDSAWTTGFNNFIWNNSKFPNPKGMISSFHQQNIKVIAWVTSMVNKESSNYQQAKEKGYLLNEGQLAKWWHGEGAFLDYTNKEAVDWWHKQMDLVLELGLDGWKCDGTDPLLIRLTPWPYSGTSKKNFISYRKYATLYYGDFYNYTNLKRPGSLIMSRPVDSILQTYYFSYSPKYVMFSGWVGDQDSSYTGFQDALSNMFHSSWKGYLNFGFDIGGYRGQNISKENYIRQVQLGAMVPLMENGGNGKHFPWVFDEETVNIYRDFAKMHTNMLPFFLTKGTEAYAKKVSVIKPLATRQFRFSRNYPNNWGYILGNDYLVYPVLNDGGIVQIKFPKGSNWVYYFNKSKVYKGKTTIQVVIPLNQSPIFMRNGSVIPFINKYLFVYPEGTQDNRTIYNEDFSDELSYTCTKDRIEISVVRFYRTHRAQPDSQIEIEILGVQSHDKIINSQSLEVQGRADDEKTLKFMMRPQTTVVVSGLRFHKVD